MMAAPRGPPLATRPPRQQACLEAPRPLPLPAQTLPVRARGFAHVAFLLLPSRPGALSRAARRTSFCVRDQEQLPEDKQVHPQLFQRKRFVSA